MTTEMFDEFECAQLVDQEFPDDWRQWPQVNQDMAEIAIARLLKTHRGAKVIEDRSYCCSKDHPRFPDNNLGRDFALVREVKLDRPVPSVAA